MKYLKYLNLFESNNKYSYIYSATFIKTLLTQIWSDIRVDNNTISFISNDKLYKVLYDKDGDVNNIYIQEEIIDDFCNKINVSLYNNTNINNIRNIKCLKRIKELKRTSRFNI